MKNNKSKNELILENEKLQEILRQIFEDCYMIWVYGRKNRIKKKDMIARARDVYCKNLNTTIFDEK